MHQYPWICLNILENGWMNCSDYARALNMHVHLICLADFSFGEPSSYKGMVLWAWHGCICKGYPEFWICLIMAPYASTTPEYVSICLNVPQYAWTWPNIPECPWMYEYPWICVNKLNKLFWLYARVLNMPRYSYKNIIFVTKVIKLEFLSATILSFFNTS